MMTGAFMPRRATTLSPLLRYRRFDVTAVGIFAAAPDAALAALFVPFETAELALPADGRVLFLRARAGMRLREMAQPGWLCEQGFLPFADELARNGLRVGEPAAGERFPLVLVLPPRQRDEARALFARALSLLAPGGTLLASMPNAEGAKSGEADLAKLAGAVQHLSKHKCRVFWARRAKARSIRRCWPNGWHWMRRAKSSTAMSVGPDCLRGIASTALRRCWPRICRLICRPRGGSGRRLRLSCLRR